MMSAVVDMPEQGVDGPERSMAVVRTGSATFQAAARR